MKWTHGDKELDEFLEHANSIHPSIKFTHEVSKTKMSFLDTTTTVKDGNMRNDLWYIVIILSVVLLRYISNIVLLY